MPAVSTPNLRLPLVDSTRRRFPSCVCCQHYCHRLSGIVWGKGRTVNPQRIKIPKNTIGPLSLVLSAMKPHRTLLTIKHQAPMDTMAFDLSRSNPKETTSDGA